MSSASCRHPLAPEALTDEPIDARRPVLAARGVPAPAHLPPPRSRFLEFRRGKRALIYRPFRLRGGCGELVPNPAQIPRFTSSLEFGVEFDVEGRQVEILPVEPFHKFVIEESGDLEHVSAEGEPRGGFGAGLWLLANGYRLMANG